MKRFLSLLPMLLAAVLLSACQQSPQPTPTPTPTPDSGRRLVISPDSPVIVVGGPAIPFEVYLQDETSSDLVTANWELSGSGNLSVTTGERTQYTPPTTLPTQTTATITATLPDGSLSKQVVLTLRTSTPGENRYSVNARVFGASTDIFVTESVSSSAVPGATVKVNGTTIPFAGGRFQGALPAPVMAGETVNLEITVPEGVITASAIMPAAPNLTAPANGSSLSAASPLELAWTMPENPSNYRLGYGTDPYESDLAVFATAPGESRTQTFTGIPANKTLDVFVIAINETTEATGPVSSFNLLAENSDASSRSTVTTTP